MNAVISPCGLYRYRLERELKPISIPEITAVVIMVNPSRLTQRQMMQRSAKFAASVTVTAGAG